MSETGALVLLEDRCRFCGALSREMHPAGVIADSDWKCTRCGHKQHDEPQQIEGD